VRGYGPVSLDVVFYNDARAGVLKDIKSSTHALRLIVEVKNSERVYPRDFNQMTRYLNDGISKYGFIVFRGNIKLSYLRQIRAIGSQGFKILILEEQEIKELTTTKIDENRNRGRFSVILEQFLQDKVLST
jgi:hypothetical protein